MTVTHAMDSECDCAWCRVANVRKALSPPPVEAKAGGSVEVDSESLEAAARALESACVDAGQRGLDRQVKRYAEATKPIRDALLRATGKKGASDGA